MLPHSRERVLISEFRLNSAAETAQWWFIYVLYVAGALRLCRLFL